MSSGEKAHSGSVSITQNTPELTAVAQASAEELVQHHADRVREHDDITALSGYGKLLGRAHTSIAAGVGGAEVALALERYATNSTSLFTAGIVASATLGLSALSAGHVLKQRRRKHFEDNNAYTLLEQTGQAYELYRMIPDDIGGKDEVVMQWHGALVPEGTPEEDYPSFLDSVRGITHMAEKAKVNFVVVDRAILETGMPATKLDGLEANQPAARFIGATLKGAKVKGLEEKMLHSFRPHELRAFVEHELGADGLDSLMHDLRSVSPEDPLVGLYDQLVETNADSSALRAEIIRTAMVRASGDALMRHNEISQHTKVRASVDNPTLITQRTDISARISGKAVQVTRSHRGPDGVTSQEEGMSILDAVGLLPRHVEALNSESDTSLPLTSQQRKVALYYKVYMTSLEDDSSRHGGSKAKEDIPTNPVIAEKEHLIQPALVNSALSPTRLRQSKIISADGEVVLVNFRRRLAISLGIAAASAALVNQVHGMATQEMHDKDMTSVSPTTTAQEAHDKNVRESGPLVQFFDALQELEVKPVAALRNQLTGLVPYVPQSWVSQGIIDKYKHNPGDPSQSDSSMNYQTSGSMLGNVDPASKNKVDWYLDPHNMDTRGYWGASVRNDFRDGYWSTNIAVEKKLSIPAKPAADAEQYTAVRRNFDGTAFNKVELPVLYGSKVVAANFDGKPVSITQSEDGAYFAQVRGDNPNGTFTYFVSPDVHAARLHRATPVVYRGSSRGQGKNVADYWKQLLPERSNNEQVRIEQEVSFIQKDFKYSLAPLDSIDTNDSQLSPLLYIMESGIKRRAANCNIAATMLAADNPSLAFANGWNNANVPGAKQQILSSHEAHAWTVDDKGSVWDATPVAGGNTGDFFDETKAIASEPEQQVSSRNALIASAALAGIYLAYRRRKTIVHAGRATAQVANSLSYIAAEATTVLTGDVAAAHARAASEIPYMPQVGRSKLGQLYGATVNKYLELPYKAPIRDTNIRDARYYMRHFRVGEVTRALASLHLAASNYIARRKTKE